MLKVEDDLFACLSLNVLGCLPFQVSANFIKPNWNVVYESWLVKMRFNDLSVGGSCHPATAEMLWGARGKLVGIGSGFPSASALARIYIWLDVDPAASIALATRSQLRISVDIFETRNE